MPKLYHHIRNFTGLSNAKDPRDITGLSKAQNISLDKGGKIRTIGGLETHGEVPTHAAVLCPGTGLYPYGSDHWRGTETIVDLLANGDATSDQQTEGNSVAGWTDSNGTSSSNTPANFGIASNGTTYILKWVPGNPSNNCSQSFTTVIGQRYLLDGSLYATDTDAVGNAFIYVGTAAGGSEILKTSPSLVKDTWLDRSKVSYMVV